MAVFLVSESAALFLAPWPNRIAKVRNASTKQSSTLKEITRLMSTSLNNEGTEVELIKIKHKKSFCLVFQTVCPRVPLEKVYL